MLLAHLGREIRFSGLNRRCITRPASSRHIHPVNVLEPARRVRAPGADLILVAGRAAVVRAARRRARRSHRAFLKEMLSWEAGSGIVSHPSELPCLRRNWPVFLPPL